jgi:hypothetical protein
MGITSGLILVGPGETYETWAAAIAACNDGADACDMTGNLELRQTGNTVEPGAPYLSYYLHGFTLTFTSDDPPEGDPLAGNISVAADPSDSPVLIEANGTGTLIISYLNVHVSGVYWPAISALVYDSVNVQAHDIIADGTGSSGIADDCGINITTRDGDIDAWNIKAMNWFETGAWIYSAYSIGSLRMENCTFIGNGKYGWDNQAGDFSSGGIVRNCVCSDNGVADWFNHDKGGMAGYDNASEDATAADANWDAGGSGNITAIVPADEFVSLDHLNADYAKLKSTGSLANNGSAVLIAGNTTGERGNVRPHGALYSIGADELVAAAPSAGSSSSGGGSGLSGAIRAAMAVGY